MKTIIEMTLEAAFERLSSKSHELALLIATQYSFEEWINWEIYLGCRAKGLDAWPKPEYKAIGFKASKSQADLMIKDNGVPWLVMEVGLIHDGTVSKWKDKINGDRDKLMPPYNSGITPIQLVVVASSSDIAQMDNWTRWLNDIRFWHEPAIYQRELKLDPTGVMQLKAWHVQ